MGVHDNQTDNRANEKTRATSSLVGLLQGTYDLEDEDKEDKDEHGRTI